MAGEFLDERDLPFEFVKTHLEYRKLETVDIWVALLEPSYVQKALEMCNYAEFKSMCPNLLQLQRVRRVVSEPGQKPVTLEVAICAVADIGRQALLDWLQRFDVIVKDLYSVSASKHAAITYEQLSEWNKLWPVEFKRDSSRIIQVTNGDIELYRKLMRMLLDVLEKEQCQDELPLAALAYDTKAERVVAVCADRRRSSGHPLRHPIYDVVHKVAHDEKEARLAGPAERQKFYLCTDLLIVTTHEPCVMCSMALVHSRVGTTVYGAPCPETGGLASAYGIHWRKELNHRFNVFGNWKEFRIPGIDKSIHA